MTNKIKKISLFFYILFNKPILLVYLFDKKYFFRKIKINSDIITFEKLINDQKSILRLGDSDLAYFRDNYFEQNENVRIFIETYKSLLKNNDLSLLIGIPNLFIYDENKILIPRRNYNYENWKYLLYIMFFSLNYNLTYSSSFVFREINFHPVSKFQFFLNKFLTYLNSTGRNVLYISDRNHLDSKIIKVNYFYEITDWDESDLNIHLNNIINHYNYNEVIILIRVKILSRILGYHLHQNGYRVLDIGQIN
jgi:hypothetical protein